MMMLTISAEGIEIIVKMSKSGEEKVFTDWVFQRIMILDEVYSDSHSYASLPSFILYSSIRDKVL